MKIAPVLSNRKRDLFSMRVAANLEVDQSQRLRHTKRTIARQRVRPSGLEGNAVGIAKG